MRALRMTKEEWAIDERYVKRKPGGGSSLPARRRNGFLDGNRRRRARAADRDPLEQDLRRALRRFHERIADLAVAAHAFGQVERLDIRVVILGRLKILEILDERTVPVA